MNIFYFVIKHFCPKIPVANRKCLACDEIEDERQLILKSIINNAEREWFFAKVSLMYDDFTNLEAVHKFPVMMTTNDPRCLKWLGKFLQDSFIRRNQHSLLENDPCVHFLQFFSSICSQLNIRVVCHCMSKVSRGYRTLFLLWSLFSCVTSPRVPWASYQIRKIAGCACAGNAGNIFLRRPFQRKPLISDPGMHYGTCVTHVPWCMSGSLTCGDEESVPGIPGACAPAILCIWQEAHALWGCFMGSGTTMLLSGWRGGDRGRYGWLRRSGIACAVHGICCTCSLPIDYMVLFTCV